MNGIVVTLDEEFLTVEEVAKMLKVEERTVTNWCRERKLGGKKIGDKLWRIPVSAYREFISRSA